MTKKINNDVTSNIYLYTNFLPENVGQRKSFKLGHLTQQFQNTCRGLTTHIVQLMSNHLALLTVNPVSQLLNGMIYLPDQTGDYHQR